MFNATVQSIRIWTPKITQTCKSKDCLNALNISAHGYRCLSTSSCLHGKVVPRKKPRVVHEIAGLEPITYADRMHYVPGLAKPTFPEWDRGWKEPRHYKSPKLEDMPLHKDKPCYIFNQMTNVLEGVRQALWLSKSILIKGLPAQILNLALDPANQIENQDDRVQNAIKNSRLWDTTEHRPPRERFCPSLVHNLLHLCDSLHVTHPELAKRILADKYSLAATWRRGEIVFQVRGQNGLLLNSMSPVPVAAGDELIQSTADQALETFYPISPTIDLQCTHVYQEKNDTGFRADYPFCHAHTLFLMEMGNAPKLYPEQLRAKMLMFAFGNALARAQALYGKEPRILEKPIVVQSVATNGRLFQFVVFQLNTTDLQSDSGVKNLAWVEEDQPLYEFAKVRPLIKKKVVQVPAGLSGYEPNTFKKFLALYLHGTA
ncbi:39S ribosomal protein L37, mitochondrial [Triplophysa rosa]|uniref:Large ribosomal subunit protein mL37 n=1 Tax=Triplophysa rosa TaxID=992332 RepID=A0A9W8C7U5_TRIRA|nr:39S ribosomal protein L37, mitochondrial [Triplophysa rosa]KAI7810160.1 39S ribosomal protein L37 [Triplophysa rosa]